MLTRRRRGRDHLEWVTGWAGLNEVQSAYDVDILQRRRGKIGCLLVQARARFHGGVNFVGYLGTCPGIPVVTPHATGIFWAASEASRKPDSLGWH